MLIDLRRIKITISAKLIKASTSRITDVTAYTFELEYPRFIHAELMTHRVFSRNSASSRAIPINTMNDLIRENPAMPIHWGKNQPGMQAKEELDETTKAGAINQWKYAAANAVHSSNALSLIGVHKQIANRVTEPFQHMKVVVTSTEWNNWDWLRYHEDAQPEIKELARLIKEARDSTEPTFLNPGEWHLPYVHTEFSYSNTFGTDQEYYDENGKYISLEEALMISASCCAQVSYRKSDGSLEKAETIFKRLVESEPCHASPVEHQLLVVDDVWIGFDPITWPKGMTHIDRNGDIWSGNIRGFIQHRQLIPNNAKYH